MLRLIGVALLLVSAACSSNAPTPDSASSAPSTSMTISDSAARTTGYSERVQARVRVDNGDGLAEVDGSIWVKTDDGRVVRVDPRTNRVTGQVPVDTSTDSSSYCQGIGVVEGALWACSANGQSTDVAEVDSATLKVKRRVPVDKVFDQLTLPAGADSLWILSDNGTKATRLSSTTGTATSSPLGTRCLQLAADAEMVVATCATQSVVLRLDPRTGQVTHRATLPEPRLAAVLDGDIWVDTAKGLTRLHDDLSVAAIYPSLSAGLGGDLVAASGAIWVRSGTGTITKIDPLSGAALEQITPDTHLTPGSLLVTNDSIWTTSGDDGLLYRLSLG